MTAQNIRTALGLLQDDPDGAEAWKALAETVAKSEGTSRDECERLLGMARGAFETRREWPAVARLLELELTLVKGTPVEGPMQAELARVYHDELIDPERAAGAYRRLLEIRRGDETATEALETDEAKRGRWRELVQRYLEEAEAATEDSFKGALLSSAAETAYRYGRGSGAAEAEPDAILALVERALKISPANRRATALAEILHREAGRWKELARVLAAAGEHAPTKDERVAAQLRNARVLARKLEDAEAATAVYEHVLDLAPGQPDALSYLAEAYGKTGDWDRLVALYEDQLRSGVKPGQEIGIIVQIGMVHWRMRGKPKDAEPYFDRLRRSDPTHAGMLQFFREHLAGKADQPRMLTILTDAQRAMRDGPDKAALTREIAKLAEEQENAQKAIEQYKTLLRQQPDNQEARDALKRLYAQTEGWNALIELYRQDLEKSRNPKQRVTVLKDIARIYRDHIKSDTALVTVLTQIVQLDEAEVEAIRELCRVYEALGRWRDLLGFQQRLAELTTSPREKMELYRSSARRWLEQFSNVQNATAAYEKLLDLVPGDEEAAGKLHELYLKRRAWPQLYALLEKQLQSADGPMRVRLLLEMAQLAAERLDRGADAIGLLKKVLEIDPAASGVLDTLEKQAEREKDFATVAEVLERRVAVAQDDPTRLAVLQKLGAVYADRLKDPAATARTWRRVLELSPGHARALRVLRESYVQSGDWDGLEELYGSQQDWEGLADFLSSVADKTSDAEQKVEVSFRAARVYEERLGAPERAVRSYERILSVRQDDARAAAALIPILEKDEKWARLPALYEILLGSAGDAHDQIALLRKLAAVRGGPLSDKVAALGYARRAYDLNPDADGALELLEAWSRAAGSWDSFVDAVETRLKKRKGSTSAKRGLRAKLAELYARELGRIDEAISSYRALIEADPLDEATIQTLDNILRSTGRKDDLRWLFELRAGQVEGTARAEILYEWAQMEEHVFSDPPRAIELLRRVIDLVPDHRQALAHLWRLLVAGGDHAAAAKVMEADRDASEGSERAGLEVELAGLYLDALERPSDALDAAVRALELRPHDAQAISILARLVEVPETRVRAAAVLEAEYSESGDARKEAQALRVMLEGPSSDRERRLALYNKLADVEESKLRAAGTAFEVVLRALEQFPDELSLWDRAGELAQRAGRPTDLADAYRAHLRDGQKLPGGIELELCERAAALHDERLGDPDGATPYLERVLSAQPTNDRAFARLKQILTSGERWGELEQLYDRAAQATTDQTARMELLNEVALVAEEIIGDPKKAITYYERILALEPLYESATHALDKLYEREERFGDLAALLELRLERAGQTETIDLKLRLGKLLLEKLHEPERALAHLEEVLRLQDANVEARHLVERFLEIGSLRHRAAAVLEGVYESRDDVRNLVRMAEIRLEGVNDAEEKRALLRRIALLCDERLRDNHKAFSALALLVPLDPEDGSARARLVETGRRLGENERVSEVLSAAADACESPATRGEILTELARICEGVMGDLARAEQVYRRVLDLDADDAALAVPASQALARIYETTGNHAALAEVLGIEVRLELDAERRRELFARIGDLYERVLGDLDKAIEAWRTRLDDTPADEQALTALERLYEGTGRWRDLVQVLRAREQSTDDAEVRRRALVKGAETLAQRLDDAGEAIAAWRSVIDEFGPERPALAALSGLYEKAARWPELEETIDLELAQADETDARLELLVKLGDVRRLHRGELGGALEAYRQALVLDPNHARCRGALEEMLSLEDARREAAETLHPLYEADGDNDRLLRVLEIEVESLDDPGERLATLAKAVRIAEGPLDDARRAFGYAVRGLRLSAGEREVTEWIGILERLAATTAAWPELTEVYRSVVDDILDGEVQLSVILRIGELARTRLGDRAVAITYFRKALEVRGDERRALSALEELYEQDGDAAALLEVLKMHVDATGDDAEKRKLLFWQAKLSSERLQDRSAAIATYEEILNLSLDGSAVTALERLYAEAGRYGDLVALYERQLDTRPANAAELRVKIAVVAHRHLGDTARCFDELAEAMQLDHANEAAVAELEAFLSSTDTEARARAGEMLEPVYLRRADWDRVRHALDARLASCEDPEERRALLKRLATLHEEQSEDYRAALDTVAKLLHEDPSDESTWSELERLAKVAGAEARLAEIYAGELEQVDGDDPSTARLARRTGDLYAQLKDTERALMWYRRAYAFEPESRPLFEAIDGLLVQERRWPERVELYRGALDHRFDPAERIATLHTIAELERRQLGQPERAIETYRAALDVDDTDARSLDALTQLYSDLGRDSDLAELYLRRAESSATAEAAAPYRLALARLQRGKMGDPSAAIDQLEAILSDLPWHREALAELEGLTKDPEHKARVVEILRPLYERSDDWTLLVRLNEERFGLAEEAQEKVEILRETSRLWETRGGDRARALASMRAAFELDPEDGETRAELVRLAEAEGAWDELAESYELGLESVDDLTRRELLVTLAKNYDEQLDDPRRALDAYRRLAALDPTELEPLEAMDTLALLLSDWPTLIDVLQKKGEVLADDEENSTLWRRVASIKLEMLEDAEGAVSALERALELSPENAATLDHLIVLYEQRRDAQRLVDLYGRRVELAGDDPDLRYDLLVRAARCYETALQSRRDAIQSLTLALEARPSDAEVLLGLERLYRAEELWDELLDNLRSQAALATTTEQRIKLRRAIGDLFARQLDNPQEAIDAYRLVLDEVPGDDDAIRAVREIGERSEDLRLEAAAILEPVLRAGSRFEDLVAVLEMRLRAQTDPEERAGTLRTIANVHEHRDGGAGRVEEALDALLRALAETPEDTGLHGDIERLAERCGGWSRYADALAERAASIFDAVVARDLYTRLGRVAEGRLDDPARAAEAYGKAVDQAGDEMDLLVALDRLYVKLGDAKALAEIIERRIAGAASDGEQADLYHRLATLQIKEFGDKAQGLGTLRLALERSPDHPAARDALEELTNDRDLFEEAAEVLESVYRASGDNERLTRLYDKRINFAPSAAERIRMRLDLARVLEERSSDARGAQAVLENALVDDPTDADVQSELERLAPITGGWSGAAAALERAIVGKTDLAPDVARELWVRLAGWQRDRVRDPAAAERAFERALATDASNEEVLRALEALQRAPGRERDLVETLRRLSRASGDGDLRREAKALAESALSDVSLAESILREMIEADDGDAWALAELTRLREQAGDFREVFQLLVRRADLPADGEAVKALRHAAAEVSRDRLGDRAAAVTLYEKIFEDDPLDRRAADELRALYPSLGRNRELLALLLRLVDIVETPGERTILRLEAARLSPPEEAMELLRAALDEEPGQEGAVVLLSQLLEQTGRDEELAELLTSQIALARERSDVAAELAFNVRLGEVFESRLNDPVRAIETYQNVLAREPSHEGALRALARLYEAKGERALAAQTLEKLLSLAAGEDGVTTALRLADVYVALKDEDGLRRALERGLELDPSHGQVRDRLRGLYEKLKAWSELAALVEKDAAATEDAAEKVKLLRRAAELHLGKRSDPAAASKLLEAASELAPGDRELLLLLCDALSASGRGKAAAETLEKIIASYGGRRSKDLAAIHHRLARAHVAEGDRERALSELDIAFKIDPGSIAVLRELGVLSLEIGDIDRAQKTFRALLLQKLDDHAPITKAEVFYYLAEISRRQNDDKKAIQMLERALENDKNLEPAKALMAQLKK